MTFIMVRIKKNHVVPIIRRNEPDSIEFSPRLWFFIYLSFVIVNVGGFLIALCTVVEFRNVVKFSVEIDSTDALHTISDKFLSIALDTSILQKGWRNFDLDSPAVINMVSALSPSYLRFGGTASDCLIFDSPSKQYANKMYPVGSDSCIVGHEDCELLHKRFIMSETDWLKINKFAQVAGLDLLFDLNVLLRNGENWDPSNAIKLIQFSHDHRFNVSWQLGNEPNSFNHVFRKRVSGTQLAKDFSMLRAILNNNNGTHVKLVGPDITRPRLPDLDGVRYLIDFLREIKAQGNGVIDAVTWHHYYLNGQNSTVKDYIDPSTFQSFYEQSQLVESTVAIMTPGLSIWLTETSDAYGGGAPSITDRFVGGFLWLDKLGFAASAGIEVVTRQSIFGGYYGLIDAGLKPTPDFWLSVIYKKLVGPKVLSLTLRHLKSCNFKEIDKIKLYAHCAPRNPQEPDGITIFGYNIGAQEETISLEMDFEIKRVDVYTLTGEDGLQSRYSLLNGKHLDLNSDGTLPPLIPSVETTKVMSMPPFSMVFWQVHGKLCKACM